MPLTKSHGVGFIFGHRVGLGRTLWDQKKVRHLRTTTRLLENDGRIPGRNVEEKKVSEKTNRNKLLENFHPSDFGKHKIIENAKAAYALATKTANDFYVQKKDQLLGHRKQEDVEWYSARVSFWMKRYENFVGLTEVKEAQVRVVKTEKTFVQAQESRRESQRLLNEVQQKIKDLHTELERTSRGEDKYLELITLEHNFLKEEKSLNDKLAAQEREEREMFSKLSRAVRDSHESERAQAEKTKYWSVLGSVIGTCLGVIGTTINNRLRMRELRQLVTESAAGNRVVASSTDAVTEQSSALERLSAKMDEVSKSTSNYHGGLTKSMAALSKTLESSLNEVAEATDRMRVFPVAQNTPSDLALLFEGQDARLKKIQDQIGDLQKAPIDKAVRTTLQDMKLKVDKIADEEAKREMAFSANYNYLGKNHIVLDSMEKRVADMEEKLKDVRSLLLSQVMSDETKLPDTRRRANSKEAAEAVERSQKTIVGAVEVAMREHERRINSTMLLNSLLVAVLAPIVAYAVSKVN